MKPRLAQLLVCPLDQGPLELVVFSERSRPLSPEERERAERLGLAPAELEREIESGLLLNPRQRLAYPIHLGIPRMLLFRAAVHEDFLAAHGERLRREHPDYALPDREAQPGEPDVLRSFSKEWTAYDWDGKAYWNLTPDAWYRCMKYMLDLEHKPVRGKRVLEVGIGIGAFADHLSTTEGSEVVGVDLGYAVDAAYRTFGGNAFLHVVQASAFALPFAAETFDLVYSFGVIHHTHSTRTAFERLSTLPKRGGRLFVWVYSPHHESRTMERRVLMAMERVLRPALWRLPERLQTAALVPLVPLYMGSQIRRKLLRREGGDAQVLYGLREAMHAARDRFTPRFIHRHTDDEVAEWFRNAGYDAVESVSRRPRPEWVPIAFTACTGVDGVRR